MGHFNLASERVRLGMTQEQLADKLNCSAKTIWKWEKDISTMPVEKLTAASKLFGCSIDYLTDMTIERV
jgi:transcriptional regulator with XRE-family HTH domain